MNKRCEYFFVGGIHRSIHSAMRRWWSDNREATHEDLSHQAEFLLQLQEERLKAALKED